MPSFANPVYARTREDVPNVTWLGKILRRSESLGEQTTGGAVPRRRLRLRQKAAPVRRRRVLEAGMALRAG